MANCDDVDVQAVSGSTTAIELAVMCLVNEALRITYTLQWTPERAQTAAAARFVRVALTVDTPPGWRTEPGHLRYHP